ncbi:MAG: TonB-dependent receptor [Chromatiales bacterium]
MLLAYETGYRIQPRENISFDLALFYNDYDNIQNFQSLDPLNPLADLQYDNNISAHSYGVELAVDWRALEWWRLQSNYSFIEVSDFAGGILGSGGSPKHQLSLRSMMDLSNNVSLDLWAYYVDELKRPASTVDIPVGEYTSLNARLAWRPQKNLELSLVGQNLLDNHHPEFTGEYLLIQTEVERSVYGLVRVNF